jgi:hypothetical protein
MGIEGKISGKVSYKKLWVSFCVTMAITRYSTLSDLLLILILPENPTVAQISTPGFPMPLVIRRGLKNAQTKPLVSRAENLENTILPYPRVADILPIHELGLPGVVSTSLQAAKLLEKCMWYSIWNKTIVFEDPDMRMSRCNNSRHRSKSPRIWTVQTVVQDCLYTSCENW